MKAALNEAKEMLAAAVSAREEAQREVEELRRQHKDQGEEMIAAIETWEAALRDEEEARFALAELQELAYRDHPEAMPWSPEDDIVVAVQRDALTAVRREHAERVETLARLPQGWEEHWELSPNGEYSRYYLHVETGEVRRQAPQTDADDEYSCDLEGEMTIPEGEMYAELEGALKELLGRKRTAAQADADDSGVGGEGDAELAVQLGQLLHAHRRARRGFGAVAVRPDAPDGMGEGEENTRWSSVGGKGGRRPKRMSAIKDEDDEHGDGGDMEGLGRVARMQNDFEVVARRARHGAGAPQPDGGGGGVGSAEAEAALDRLAARLGVAPAAAGEGGGGAGRRGSTTAIARSELVEAIATLRQAVRAVPPPPSDRKSTTGPVFVSMGADSENRPTPEQVEKALSVLRVHLAAATAGRRSAVADVIDVHHAMEEDGGVAPLVAEITEIFNGVSLDKDDLETVLMELTDLCAAVAIQRKNRRGSMAVPADSLDLYEGDAELQLDTLLENTLQTLSMHHEWLRTESLRQGKRPHRGSCTLSMDREWLSSMGPGAGGPPRRPKASLQVQDDDDAMGGDDDDGMGMLHLGAPKVRPRPGGRRGQAQDDDDAMGDDDDDGMGMLHLGAPKVRPRPGGRRATVADHDDDEMGGGDDELDFARGLSALERAKAARLQAERERQAAERERLRLEREKKRDTRGAEADTDQDEVGGILAPVEVDLGIGWTTHGAAPARPVAAEDVEDELARTLTLALHRTLSSKARRTTRRTTEYEPSEPSVHEEDDLVANMEQLLQNVNLRQRRRRPEDEAKAAAAAAAAAAVVTRGRGSIATSRQTARRRDTRHDPLAAVQRELERGTLASTAEAGAPEAADAAVPAAAAPRQSVVRTVGCDGATVRRRCSTGAAPRGMAASPAVPTLKLERRRSSMIAAAAAVVVRTPRVATPRLREGSVADERSALIAPLRLVLALAVRLPRTYLLAATEPPADAVAEGARLRRDAMRALEVLAVTPHADAQRTLDELRERLERAFAAVPSRPAAAAPAAATAGTSAHATGAEAASGAKGGKKLTRAGGFAPRDAAVLAVHRKEVRPSVAPGTSIDKKLDAAAADKEAKAAREAAATAREEATMLAWVRGLQLPALEDGSLVGVSLSEACTSGLLLLAVADHLHPGAVEWDNTHAATPRLWQRAANCAEALAVFSALGFRDAASVVKPADLALGAAAPRARALLWLLMRQEMLQLAGTEKGGGSALIGWANRRVGEYVGEHVGGLANAHVGGALRITRFDDPKLHTGFYLLRLLRVIAPAAVDASDIRLGATQAEAEANAKLLVPSAQALLAGNARLQRRASMSGSGGGAVFACWEDVVECRPKMLLCLLAALKCEDERRIAAAKSKESKGRRPSLPRRASARGSSERLSARISERVTHRIEFGSFFRGGKQPGAPPPPPGAPPPPTDEPPSDRLTTVEVPMSHAAVDVEVAGGASPGGKEGGKQENRVLALLLAPMRRTRAFFRSRFGKK